MGRTFVRPYLEKDMQYYFAPLEGLTDSIYRKLHHRYFPGLSRYYTPFFSPTCHRDLTPRERRELPESSEISYPCVPQLLTKVPEDFIWMAGKCQDLGYTQVNLNLGCPSGTVTAKGKGAGMLTDLDSLDRFLDLIFHDSPLPISVKTRIGFRSGEEFPALMEIFNQYPIAELIVHPRHRAAFYNGSVDMDAFRYALSVSRVPLCYNGDLCTIPQIDEFAKEFPQIGAVMIGRGLIGNPGMFCATSTDTLQAFHDDLLEEYLAAFGGSRNAMFRLKENWRYLICLFEENEKLAKRLHKTTDITEFRQITNEIFATCPRKEHLQPDW